MNTELMFSSKTDLWATPQVFFDKYNTIYNFKIDVCALPENAKCQKYFTPEIDGLSQDWNEDFWMNPPYGRDIIKWIKKAYEEHIKHNVNGVLLLPGRTDTKWFHNYCLDKGEIHFIKGRLKFGNQTNSAPFPSIVVIYNKK